MNRIADTDMCVFPITLGTMTFGTPVASDDAVNLILYALKRGINMIDTANMYEGYARVAGSAGGVAEEIVGKALKSICRADVLVATKVGMKVGTAPEDEGTSPAAIRKQLDASLKRLDTDYVDLYYLHRPDESIPLADILGEIGRQMDAGKIRSYGVSNYSAQQLEALLRVAKENGLKKPVVCQPPLSLLKQEAFLELMPLCIKEQVSVIPYQIFQGGLLTGKYRRGIAPPAGSRADEKPDWVWKMDAALFDKLEEIERVAQSENCSIMQYAVSWVLRQPTVVSAIVGVKNKKQIDDAITAATK